MIVASVDGLHGLHGQHKRGDGAQVCTTFLTCDFPCKFGNANQVQAFVQTNSHLRISKSHAAKIARRDGFTLFDYVHQFSLLPSLQRLILDRAPCCVFNVRFSEPDVQGVRRFESVLFGLIGQHDIDGNSPSTSLRASFSLDGTPVHSIARGTLLTSACYSSDNQLFPLLMLYCGSECKDNVDALGCALRRDFNYQTVPICDSGTALVAGLTSAGFRDDNITGCTWHVGYKNLPSKFPGVPKLLMEAPTVLATLCTEKVLTRLLSLLFNHTSNLLI
jgi:hypothetical protein